MSGIYTRLLNGQIRTIILLPGTGDKIRISMQVCSLSTTTETQAYEAVSYVWGPPIMTSSLMCDGIEVKVTGTIYSLLRCLRHEDSPRRLWIDAVCINQADIQERNFQVSLMKQIYANASRVLIWLGDQQDDTWDIAYIFAKWQVTRREKFGAERVEYHKMQEKIGYDRRLLDTIRRLSARAWFHRVWTFQEACLAQQAVVLEGQFQIQWSALLTAATDLEHYNLLQYAFGSAGDSIVALTRWSSVLANTSGGYGPDRGMYPSLLDLLILTRNLEATDPRDKIYAVLGVLEEQKNPGVFPDYTASVEELFIGTAQKIIRRDGDLSILSNCFGSLEDTELPSWVPDWRVPRRTALLKSFDWSEGTEWAAFYKIAGSQSRLGTEPPTVIDSRHLVQRGARIGNIVSVAGTEDFLSEMKGTIEYRWDAFDHLFRELSDLFGMGPRYAQTGETSQMALLRTLSVNMLPTVSDIRRFLQEISRRAYSEVEKALRHAKEDLKGGNKKDGIDWSAANAALEYAQKAGFFENNGHTASFLYKWAKIGEPDLPAQSALERPNPAQIVTIYGNKYSIPVKWMTTLLDIHTRQVSPTERSGLVDHDMEDIDDFLAVCDIAWTGLELPMPVPWVTASGNAFPVKAGLFSDQESWSTVDKMSSVINTFSSCRSVFRTGNGLIGLGPDNMETDDELWYLAGADVPFILSPCFDDSGDKIESCYNVIGECYVHGIMNGELWENQDNGISIVAKGGQGKELSTIRIE